MTKQIEPLTGLTAGLEDLIDWPTVLAQPRYAGGHREVMRNIFGPKAQVLSHWVEDDYQGTTAIALQVGDKVVIMSDYFGSCSGCDAWEDSDETEARRLILGLAHNARVFKDLEEAKSWCHNMTDERPWEYPFYAAKNLWTNNANQH